jgi:tRNA pseudouridine32 synthase/23S rRNA pseudouridine746 synthase
MTRPAPGYKPAMRDGVSASCVALPGGPWSTVAEFLAHRLSTVSLDEWHKRMAQGHVLNDEGQALAPAAPYRAQSRVFYYRELPEETPIPFEAQILFEDRHIVVADKPHFLPVIPTGRFVRETLLVRLKLQLGLEDLSPIHRIDRETAGLVLFSKRPKERGAYQSLFRQREVRKHYEAIAPWFSQPALPAVHRSRIEADDQFFRQREVPGEPNSETHLSVLEVSGVWARYALQPVTGKTHQLRVHMNALDRPIAGDRFYPKVLHTPASDQHNFDQPLQLLARRIDFKDPISGEHRVFDSQRELHWPLTTSN